MHSPNDMTRCVCILTVLLCAALPLDAIILSCATDWRQEVRVDNVLLQLCVSSPVASVRLEGRIAPLHRRADEASLVLFLPGTAAVDSVAARLNTNWIAGTLMDQGTAQTSYRTNVDMERRKKWPRDPVLLEDLGGGLYRLRVYPVPEQGTVFRIEWKQPLVPRGQQHVFEFAHQQYAQFADTPPVLDVVVSGERPLVGRSAVLFRREAGKTSNKVRLPDPADGIVFAAVSGIIPDMSSVAQKQRFSAAWESFRKNPGQQWPVFAAAARETGFVNPLRALLGLEPGMKIHTPGAPAGSMASFTDPARQSAGAPREGRVKTGKIHDGFGGPNNLLVITGGPLRRGFDLETLLNPSRSLQELVEQRLQQDLQLLESGDNDGKIRLLYKEWRVLGDYLWYADKPALRNRNLLRDAVRLKEMMQLARYGLTVWDLCGYGMRSVAAEGKP